MSRAWFDAPERVRLATGRDDALAFGVAEAGALFTPVLLSASTHILTYLGQELCRGAARELASRIIGQLRRLILAWISQTRTYQGGEPGRHLHFSGTQDLVCW
jgi:hypothetical protein